ncbi:MAG TPA: acyl carrier protein [Vicinamibacterales bacterium]|jgi:acyl carrier protein
MLRSDIEAIVLETIRTTNLARDPGQQLEVSPAARIFGRGSALDSMGLVTLLLDVEEALGTAGQDITLTDDRAMSQSRSPFRSVPALVEYIAVLLGEAPCPPAAAS